MRLNSAVFVLISLLMIAMGTSCKKEKILTSGGEIRFSADTVKFDTVFTSLGSFTTQFKIYNPQNQKINISSVVLEKGASSFFHINVNGISGSATNIELAAKDSMYVFATVNIDPNNKTTPFVVEDKVIATMNGKNYEMPLMAYGQNAHYIVWDSVGGQTWQNDLPYVVIGGAIVDRNKTLTIEKGCRIYMHAGAFMYVDGSLVVNGTKKDSVIFQGDRLDRKYFGYEGYPGEWGGLYFTSFSVQNNINYAILKNCGGGVVQGGIFCWRDSSGSTDYKVKLNNSIIENSFAYGIIGYAGTRIKATNCLINGCGAQTLITPEGGLYDFDNCDFITFGNNKISHIERPVMGLINYNKVGDVIIAYGDIKATLTNCVIWGSLDNECFVDRYNTNTLFDVKLVNCVIKQSDAINYATVTNRINTDDPKFTNNTDDFRPRDGSPMIDKGISNGVTEDLNGKTRSNPPDIGCYEY